MSNRPIRVLVVENDDTDFTLVRALFGKIRQAMYEVERASSVQEAVQFFGERKHDVYLVSDRLGSESGLGVVQKAQEMRLPAPVILLTGQEEPENSVTPMFGHAADILVKDEITACSLERTVRYAIERKRAKREIEKLAAFPRSNPNPVLGFAEDGTVNYSNFAAESLALSLGESSLKPLLPPDIVQIVGDAIQSGNTRQFQTSRGTRTFAWSLVPVREDKVVHGYAFEITDRVSLEAQLRYSVKMEAVGQLAAGVAHDFNNILTVIQGHASLLLEALEDSSDHGKPLKHICLSAEKAANLIRQLLMFSRKQVIQPRHIDLNELLQNLTRMLQRMMGEDIALDVIEHSGLPSVHGDTGMIEQVLMNLAVNAREAMPRGGRLRIATTIQAFAKNAVMSNPEARAGEFVCLTVSDTGCGIDPSILNRIFEPFFTTKEVGKGTGLGLAAVYGIVKQHQGWIEVDSTIGAGTTFRLYFPVSAAPSQPVTGSAPTDKVSGGNETILVVEDESALRELVEEILSLYGYDVVSACSGVDALRVWEKHREKIDLLLTDMVMPEGISGRELAERLQHQVPKLKVIYTSGYSPGMAGKDLALLEGFNFLPKPYPPTRLAEVVRECLDGKFEAMPAS